MNRWTLAARNLVRHRRRSVLTGAIVAFGFTALTLAGGFMAQSFKGLREGAIRSGLGHIQFADARSFDSTATGTLAYPIRDAATFIATLARDARVRAVMPRVEFFGLAGNGAASLPFMGVGVDPAAEAAGSDIPRTVVNGRWLHANEHAAVLGAGLARALGVHTGDTLTLLATTPAGALNALDVAVVGIANIPVRALDDRYLATSVQTAGELLDTSDTVTRVSVLLDRDGDEQRVAMRLRETLKERFPEIETRRWDELAEFYAQVRVLYLGIFGFMGAVLVVVVFLAAFNATLMSVAERTREIGTLRAIGMRQRDIRHQFVREGALAGLTGSIAGALLTLFIILGLNASGIMLPAPPGATRAIPLHIEFFPWAWLFAGAAMTATLAIAAWFPARRAARLPIVEALGHV